MIYLDNNATTPCDPRVVEEMLPYFNQEFGNPSNSLNLMGRKAAGAVDVAREWVSNLIGAQPTEIVFTGSATEANNLAILGFCRRNNNAGGRHKIITSAIEHKSVLKAFEKLETEGFERVIVPVNRDGTVDLSVLWELVDESTLLVSIQAVNNEVGTIQPIRDAAEIAHAAGAVFHCDASQAIGKIDVDVTTLGIDMMSISAHKFYGPKGIGVLYGRGNLLTKHIEPLIYGGGQERDIRPGTYNVPMIVGLGTAARILLEEQVDEKIRIRQTRDAFEAALRENIPELRVNGVNVKRIANTSNITFPGVDADAMLLNCPQLMMGTGSACNAGAIEPSYVLSAMGIDRAAASATIRGGFGRFNKNEDAVVAAETLTAVWRKLSRIP